MENGFILYQEQDLPANTSVLSHKFSEVTSSGRPRSYILLPRPLLGTISFSIISCLSPSSLDVGLSHLSRLLSSSVSLATVMSVLKMVVSEGGVLLGLALGVNQSDVGPTVATWKNICIWLHVTQNVAKWPRVTMSKKGFGSCSVSTTTLRREVNRHYLLVVVVQFRNSVLCCGC